MLTYCKLKAGEIKVVFSDNTEEETMHLFPLSDLEEGGTYNAEDIACSVHGYDEVAVTDTNLHLLQGLQKAEKEGYEAAILRYEDETILTGDARSIRSVFNNLTGKNFEDPEEHKQYLLMMECKLDVPNMDPAKITIEEV